MKKRSKIAFGFSTLIGIGIIVTLFILLLRACLSAEDEYHIAGKSVVFEKNNQEYLLYILNYQKCTSYESSGGFTSKSMSPYFYFQVHGCDSSGVIQSLEIENDEKNLNTGNTKILGKSGNLVWYFAGDLFALDLKSFNPTVSLQILEDRNPQMKGMFPEELTYYSFDNKTENVVFTSRNGVEMRITDDLKVVENTKKKAGQDYKAELEEKIKNLQKMADSVMRTDRKNYDFSRQLRDSAYLLSNQMHEFENLARSIENKTRKVNDLMKDRISTYRSICTNGFVYENKLYCLLKQEDVDGFNGNFYFRGIDYDNKIHKIYTANLKKVYREFENYMPVDKLTLLNENNFLGGGILMDYKTLLPIFTKGKKDFIIVSKKFIEDTSPNIITAVDLNAEINWTTELSAGRTEDIIIGKEHLIFIIRDDKTDENSVLSIVNLQTGKVSTANVKEDFKK